MSPRLLWCLPWLFCAGVAPAASPASASLQVAVFDESGLPAEGVHVYLFSQSKKKFVGIQDVDGAVILDLPVGRYRVYAAVSSQNHGYIEHYASPEAVVSLSLHHPNSVILYLRRSSPSKNYLSDSALKKLGIDQKLAQFLN